MRARLILPVAAALVLAGCNPQPAGKTGESAQVKMPGAASEMSPVCPPAPVCVPEAAAKGSPGRAAKGTTHRYASRGQAASHRTGAAGGPRRAAARGDRHDDLAGGRPQHRRWSGGAGEAPESGYRYRRYADEGYRYGPAPQGRPDDGRGPAYDRREDQGRDYADRARPDDRRESPPYAYRSRPYDRHDRTDDRRHDRDVRPYDDARGERADGSGYAYRRGPAAGHDDRGARPDAGSRSVERYSSEESSGSRRQGGYVRDGSRYSYDSRRQTERSASESYERRSWSQAGSSRSGSASEGRRGSGDCCQPASSVGAAGFDRHGFLTWPGKVPARP